MIFSISFTFLKFKYPDFSTLFFESKSSDQSISGPFIQSPIGIEKPALGLSTNPDGILSFKSS